MDKETFIELSGNEVITLIDRVKNSDEDFESGEPIARALLLKLFSLFNELTDDTSIKDGTECLVLSERELWLLRSKISPFDTVNGEGIGIKLCRKLHIALLQLNSDIHLQVEEESVDLTYNEAKEAKDARSQDDAQDDAYDDPEGEATAGTRQTLSGSEGQSEGEDRG